MRFVVDSSVVFKIASGELEVHPSHQLVAPALVRSQALERIHAAFRRGELARKEAIERSTVSRR